MPPVWAGDVAGDTVDLRVVEASDDLVVGTEQQADIGTAISSSVRPGKHGGESKHDRQVRTHRRNSGLVWGAGS